MLLEVCGRSNIETHASRRTVLRDEGPGNIESPPRCGAAGDGHAALRRGRRARGSRRKPRNENFDLRRVALGTEHPALRTEQRCCVYTIVCSLVQFAWDERKSQANLRERGFDFAFASLIFDGITVAVEDRRRDYREKRMVAIEEADGIRLTVVYTDRQDDGGVTRRIISARRSNRRERRIHTEAAEG